MHSSTSLPSLLFFVLQCRFDLEITDGHWKNFFSAAVTEAELVVS